MNLSLSNAGTKLAFFLIVLLVAVARVANTGSAQDLQQDIASKSVDPIVVTEEIVKRGRVTILILLVEPTVAFEETDDQATSRNRALQYQFLARHFGDSRNLRSAGFDRNLKLMNLSAMLSITVNESELRAIATDPQVQSIQLDSWDRTFLSDSIPLIGMETVFDEGTEGSGETIVVLDTGVERGHPFIASERIVKEFCFSTRAAGISESLCNAGLPFSETPGSGANCNVVTADSGLVACGHGTHVAGIAAGRNLPGGIPPSGVARGANIVAAQVFSRVNDAEECQKTNQLAPCIVSQVSDQIRALEYVATYLSDVIKISAVNMSLGGGLNYGHCDKDKRKPIIDRLRRRGIATVIAAGNDYSAGQIAVPACISSAVSVAATRKDDIVAVYSNNSSSVTLLAPGGQLSGDRGDIFSSFPGRAFRHMAGTSMAAPHVAGAIAILKSKFPDATVNQIVHALDVTGKSIRDDRNGMGLRKSRINVDKALLPMLTVSGSSHVISGPKGGEFSPNYIQYSLSSVLQPAKYKVSVSVPWLSLESSEGEASPSKPAKIMIKVDANKLPIGDYSAAINISNVDNNIGNASFSVSLTVHRLQLPRLKVPDYYTLKGITKVSNIRNDRLGKRVVAIGTVCRGGNCAQLYRGHLWRVNGSFFSPGGDSLRSEMFATDSDGMFAVGATSITNGPCSLGFRVDTEDRFSDIPPAAGFECSSVRGISTSGKELVGVSFNQDQIRVPTFWPQFGRAQTLPMLPDFKFRGEPVAVVTENELMIIGNSTNADISSPSYRQQGTVWRLSGPTEGIGFFKNYRHTKVVAASADGRLLVGTASNRDKESEAFIYSGGKFEGLGIIGSGATGYSEAIAFSSDGQAILGRSNGEYFRWSRDKGMVPVRALLAAEYDIDAGDIDVTAMSPDGKVLSGSLTIRQTKVSYPFVVTLSEGN
jgi:subtilisin family serine protease